MAYYNVFYNEFEYNFPIIKFNGEIGEYGDTPFGFDENNLNYFISKRPHILAGLGKIYSIQKYQDGAHIGKLNYYDFKIELI